MKSTTNTLQINKKTVAKAVLLPGILPRLKDLFTSPLIFLAYGYALLFVSVKLLPKDHPYVNPKNFGRFGITNVMSAASENIEFELKYIDRIISYFSVVASFIILALLGLSALIYVFFNIAWASALPAGSPTLMGLFTTPAPANDIALMMLDATFGIPGIFNSSLMPVAPSPFHAAMQNSLFGIYNNLFLVIGVVIMLIHLGHAVYETTQTGTLFGRRFNSFWGPFRLIVGVGLLIPVAYGMNSGQYIILYTAKHGSALATNAWNAMTTQAFVPIGGVDVSANNYRSLISEPPPPAINALVGFMHLVSACRFFYENANGGPGDPNYRDIEIYQIHNQTALQIDPTSPPDFATTIMINSGGNPVNIRIGALNTADSYKNAGGVEPLCGELTLDIYNATIPGAMEAYERHYLNIMTLYMQPDIRTFGRHINHLHLPESDFLGGTGCIQYPNAGDGATCHEEIPARYGAFMYNDAAFIQNLADTVVLDSVTALSNDNILDYTALHQSYGWAGAGLWYGEVSDINGNLIDAVMYSASVTSLPLVLEDLMQKRMLLDNGITSHDMFSLFSGMGVPITNIGSSVANEDQLVKVLEETYQLLLGPRSKMMQALDQSGNNNSSILLDLINAVLGTSGIANIQNNPDTHAMFQLTGIGRGLINASIRNLLASSVASFGAGLTSQLDDPQMQGVSKAISAVGQAASSLGTITLTAGIILFYIVPLMPFMYFFFACGRWVKSVFEALVGTPLWALAHLQYEGEGIGELAISGYYLIFEILIRPILILFGLIAGLGIFGAMVVVMNDIWSLIVTNLTGFDHSNPNFEVSEFRDRIDQLFFTLLYVILIYMMAQSSFKLIDMIPNQILRWMGSSTSSFGDMSDDPLDRMTSTAAIKGAQMTPQIAGAADKASELGGMGVGNLIKKGQSE